MKNAFTLVELLVVIGIMALLGTTSVAGYRQMQRGMEERGVMQNVNQFIRTAYQRAQIDRSPTAVFFWNETLRSADSAGYENEIVVGHAVAVRRQGRFSRATASELIDEFSELDKTYTTNSVSGKPGEIRIYELDNPQSGMKYSYVSEVVERFSQQEYFVTHSPMTDPFDSQGGSAQIQPWGFRIKDKRNANWQNGSAYGFEFASLTLPHGYIFTAQYSKNAGDPIQNLDAQTMVFLPAIAGGTGSGGNSRIEVYSLRPNTAGVLAAQSVDRSDAPSSTLDNDN